MNPNLITKIRVDSLFGLYTYDLPEEGQLTDAAILYGDNGVGKSTLLRLVYHLLSAANDRGHRTALFKSNFKRLEVNLSSGVRLTAKLEDHEDQRFLALKIKKGGKTLAKWHHHPRHHSEMEWVVTADGRRRHHSRRAAPNRPPEKGSDDVPTGSRAYIEELKAHAPNMFILNADRRLDSDTVSDPSDEMEIRRLMRYDAPSTIHELVVRSREIGLSQALSTATRWISKKAILGTNQGSTNVHTVYVDVVKHLTSPYTRGDDSSEQISTEELIQRLEIIEQKMAQHAKYELATTLSTGEFRDALGISDTQKGLLAAELLKTYIRSLDRRLEAVEPIYEVIDTFISKINDFLNDKSISFQLSKGFSITNPFETDLEASQLSSGEQQLLLLFCYVLTARDRPSVFMIDEPEISLNIKWQRKLIQALLDITEGSEIQFIFASHSMELLAQHRSRVVQLSNKGE